MRWAILPAVLGLAGCVNSSSIVTPTGHEGFSINCSSQGIVGSSSSCLEEAARRCPAGYTILNADEPGAAPVVTGSTGSVTTVASAAGQDGTAPQPAAGKRNMIVECKPQPPPKPDDPSLGPAAGAAPKPAMAN